MPIRAEAIGRDVDQVNQRALVDANGRPANASPSEPPSTSDAAANDVSSGERLHVGMTEEALSGDYRMTMQRDRRGRWVPTREERTMTIKEATEARRNLYVGESRKQTDIHDCREKSISADGMPTRCRGNVCLPRSARSSGEQSKPSGKECLILKAVTIIDPAQADVIREKQRDRVISSRLILRWKETDTACKAMARWCVPVFKDSDIHEIERSRPTPEVSSINITLQILASTASEGTLADGERGLRAR